ncbi:hypothetical protein [Metallosphaera hakonensis]|uniref:Uncharacterized protein n=1 Tax=Metallosphaera hakonensis JCM 8857 = DSM 7519 TaxID=1293036 RepID=A0A2U9IWP2_9CREN|nr:hypothetical protein [Metallosphaera hakonensis]AWS00364.1 hypothetical protein DFR87_12540 [Metallosphaera hakonensis JCM 8857 = DSM 7519]
MSFSIVLELINVILSAISAILLWRVFNYYVARIERIKGKILNVKTVDFLIALTDLLSQGETFSLIDDLIVYISNLQGREWGDIYNEVIKRFGPIKAQLELVLKKANDFGSVETRINMIRHYAIAGKILAIVVISEIVLGPLSELMSSLQYKIVLYGNIILFIGIILVLIAQIARNINLLTSSIDEPIKK